MTDAKIYNEDCITGMRASLAPDSIHLTVTSIPFEELFTYSGKPEDVGNNGSTVDLRAGRFALNLQFWIAELLRVTRPGCCACIHIQQLLAYKNQHGFIGRRDFRGALIDLFARGGWEWKGECAIAKNPQAMAQRLNLHSLMFVTGRRDATGLAPAPNDYVMVFRKPGDCAEKVRCLYDPAENPKGWVTQEDWIKWACGVWDDINEFDLLGNTVNTLRVDSDAKKLFKGGRNSIAEGDEKHVCPLQLEVIRRCIRLYSNPGAVILDPFMGIGSVAAVAIEQKREAIGFELKDSYHQSAVWNVDHLRRTLQNQNTGLFALQPA